MPIQFRSPIRQWYCIHLFPHFVPLFIHSLLFIHRHINNIASHFCYWNICRSYIQKISEKKIQEFSMKFRWSTKVKHKVNESHQVNKSQT